MARRTRTGKDSNIVYGDTVTIPARRALAFEVKKGKHIKIINRHGTQVVDCWAFNADNTAEFMSMEHCRVSLGRYRPRPGDDLITNARRPILRFVTDTSPGVHDTLMAACDRYRYELLGCTEYHRNCTDNLWEAMVAAGYKLSETPCPFNLWQNTPVLEDGSIEQRPTLSRPGDHVVFRAHMDVVVCLSCCPQDIVQINSGKP
ncbi:MAG: urea carboxylase-associated family protein, partial [Gammaproteobacteria bacterium]|nr:urea carboxylase-associated family protein [Gammaproteobacteria bacterium]